ncbi:hypothetical protein L484_018899 [Morus notabilis]|uniref:Agenet domain-containing protein n=1 Tax=Morus notabilis TaxID=981085 RepID=W9R071_9ROSA|nr:hypothetical protein L484_018899 [Morus notabilis]
MATNAEPNKPIFRPGSAVEISSDEPGFQGSFYLGTVISLCSSDSYLVEYKTLVTESSRPLREEVGLFQVRPPPPSPSPGARWIFGMGDEVDVYHNDGWWEAVVTADLGNGRFEVFFRSYKEQMEFSKENMRLHRDWIGGGWVPHVEEEHEQVEKSQTEMEINGSKETVQEKFVKGELVEVSSDEDGFEGAWFSATIVEPTGTDKFLVEYQSLRTEDDKDFLTEDIDILHIRPCPAETLVVGFRLLEEVDCLYNDGWWVGVVSKVLGDSRYIVYFKDTKEEMEFHHFQMRLHHEWIDGKWVVASEV